MVFIEICSRVPVGLVIFAQFFLLVSLKNS
jgi:hypothetical protein